MTAISLTNIRTQLDASRTNIAAIFRSGLRQQQRYVRKSALADTDNLRTRTHAWTQKDDQAVDTGVLIATSGTAGLVLTATLSVDGDDVASSLARLLLNKTIKIELTTIVGTNRAYLDCRTTSGDRPRLKRGVRYRWTIANTTPASTTAGVVMSALNLLSVRRDR